MYPWQEKLLLDIEGGWRPGEMMVMMSGRRAGKSMLNAMMHKAMEDYLNPPLKGFEMTEKAVSGTQYYCVEPVGGNWINMLAWAKTTYGDPADIWEAHNFVWPDTARWYANNRKLWFRDEADRTLFLMKWS